MADLDVEMPSVSENKIIVGIDFGTTYSGVAWAQTRRPGLRSIINTWPVSKTVRDGESSDKVPTKLRYAANGETQWGFTIPITAAQDEIIEWFKLDLDPQLQAMGQPISVDGSRGGRNAPQLVAEFMAQLGDHLMYTLRGAVGDDVENMPLEFVVTVPAIWSDLAKDKTKQACERASRLSAARGFVHLVSEPEAAALYVLHSLDSHGLEIGNTVVIVDAGGGTVDLISYTITKLNPTLEVQEAAPGSGAMCGSAFLNMRFAKFLKFKLGNEEGFSSEVIAEAMEVFEKQIKRQFAFPAAPDQTYAIPVVGLADNMALGINRGRFHLKASDLQDIFEPVVLEVIRLVKEQITASNVPICAILLVGGFGASNYLKEWLRKAVDPRVQLLRPPNAWQAVVQGAVMKGLANNAPDDHTMVKIQNRRARRHYGVEVLLPYNDIMYGHLRDKKVWFDMYGCYYVSIMSWFIKRGEIVSENEPFSNTYHWRVPFNQSHERTIKMAIYSDSTQRDAPSARDENVQLLSVIEADISHIPEHLVGRFQGADGQMYYQLTVEIEAVYLSASTTYTLRCNGQRYNTVTCEYV